MADRVYVSRRWHRRWLYAHVPPYRWWKHSKLHQRLVLWRWRRKMKKLERTFGRKLTPAIQRATAAMNEWLEVSRGQGPRGG